MDLLFAKRAEHKSTLVLVTHDANLVKRCSRVVRMRSGQIEEAADQLAAVARLQ
jgi:putative ABC transport system ATP-binding protein